MNELKYEPVNHSHAVFLKRAKKRSGFNQAYSSLELEYVLANEMLKVHSKADPAQGRVNP